MFQTIRVLSTFPSKFPQLYPESTTSLYIMIVNYSFIADFSNNGFIFYSPLPNKAWRRSHFLRIFFDNRGMCNSTQVHIRIARYSYINYFHEFIGNALARFERFTLLGYKGTRTVCVTTFQGNHTREVSHTPL